MVFGFPVFDMEIFISLNAYRVQTALQVLSVLGMH